MSRGQFITLEGIDGAGKSSHIAWIAERLRGLGHHLVVTREPGGTPLGERLRELVLHEPMDLRSETLLVFAARQEHLAKVIRPALDAGLWVLSDRFTDATFAYQGGGRGLAAAKIKALETWVQEGLDPDLTVFFDVPVAVGQARRRAAETGLDRFEQESAAFHERVRDAYLARARQHPARYRIVNGAQPLDDVRKELDILFIA